MMSFFKFDNLADKGQNRTLNLIFKQEKDSALKFSTQKLFYNTIRK